MHTSISLKYPVSLEKSEDTDTPHLNYHTKVFYQTTKIPLFHFKRNGIKVKIPETKHTFRPCGRIHQIVGKRITNCQSIQTRSHYLQEYQTTFEKATEKITKSCTTIPRLTSINPNHTKNFNIRERITSRRQFQKFAFFCY